MAIYFQHILFFGNMHFNIFLRKSLLWEIMYST